MSKKEFSLPEALEQEIEKKMEMPKRHQSG
jgi:hypothetical protein